MNAINEFRGPTHGHIVIPGAQSASGGTINFNFGSGHSAQDGKDRGMVSVSY